MLAQCAYVRCADRCRAAERPITANGALQACRRRGAGPFEDAPPRSALLTLARWRRVMDAVLAAWARARGSRCAGKSTAGYSLLFPSWELTVFRLMLLGLSESCAWAISSG